MTSKLIDRYLYAVSKELPEKIRTDVEEELRSLIMDMAEERSEGGEVTEDIILEVLKELGHPTEMAEKYQPEGSRFLIGPSYYSEYLFILKIVAGCVVAGTVISWLVGIVVALDVTNISLYITEITGLVNNIIQGLCGAFTFVTVLFAVFQRNEIALNIRKSIGIEDLPDVPDKSAQIKKSEAAAQIIFGVLFPVMFLAIPEKLGYFRDGSGDVVYLFNTENIRNAWYLLLAIALLAVVQGIISLYAKRYTKHYAITYVLIDTVTMVLFWIFWMSRDIFHPSFASKMGELFSGGGWNNSQQLIMVFVILITVIECASVVWKAWKYDK